MRRLFVIGAALALATSASAGPSVANATQKGTLLILPDIRVDDGFNTIVRLSNDADQPIDVKCTWIDGNKNRTDFTVTLTKFQTIWFDAKHGGGYPYGVNPMPKQWAGGIDNPFLPPRNDGPTRKGLLVCFAVNADETDIVKWNHLYAAATVFNRTLGTAYEYTAYGLTVLRSSLPPLCTEGDASTPTGPATPVPCRQPGELVLDGLEFDQCPLYLAGSLHPDGHSLVSTHTQEDWFDIDQVRLAVATCDLDLRQDYILRWTKLQFDVWDANEVKRTGGFECADSWHQIVFPNLDAASQVFRAPTDVARYTVRAVQSSQCDTEPPTDARVSLPIQTAARGLLAVQATRIEFGEGGLLAEYGTTLTAAGKKNGKVWWDPEDACRDQVCGPGGVPEGRIR